jgi:hypothetical protein
MFGTYEIGKSVVIAQYTLRMYKDSGVFVYERAEGSDIISSTVISSASSFCVHPVEPVTQPKEISHHLLIQLTEPLYMAPKSQVKCYITFPIEIGVYISSKGQKEQIDSFTLTHPKYTLYGTPEHGEVCKLWSSSLHHTLPQVDPSCEGIMKVEITNGSGNWIKITKLVFDAFGMKIFFKDFACMNATMEVINNQTARTTFVEKPIKEPMKKAVEYFTLRKILIVEKGGYLMEWGL